MHVLGRGDLQVTTTDGSTPRTEFNSGSPPMTRNHTPNKTAQRSQPMIALPNEKELLEDIRSSLDAVGKDENQLSIPDWFQRIASTLATRVNAIGLTFLRRKASAKQGWRVSLGFRRFRRRL